MKIIFVILSMLMFMFPVENTISKYGLQEAMQKGLIECSFTGNDNSPHYVRPLMAVLKNNSSGPVQVAIDNGLQFKPDNPDYQNLLITNAVTIFLQPNETKEMPLYAMCTEASDVAPKTGAAYHLSSLATGKIKELAKLIEQKKMHNSNAQQAVWCLTSGHSIHDISGFDTSEVRTLQKFVANATGVTLPPPPAADDYHHNYYVPPRDEVSYSGVINFRFSAAHDISLGLFNERNILIRELYNNPAQAPGACKIEYTFDNSVYTDPVYYVRLVVDGDVLVKRKIEMN